MADVLTVIVYGLIVLSAFLNELMQYVGVSLEAITLLTAILFLSAYLGEMLGGGVDVYFLMIIVVSAVAITIVVEYQRCQDKGLPRICEIHNEIVRRDCPKCTVRLTALLTTMQCRPGHHVEEASPRYPGQDPGSVTCNACREFVEYFRRSRSRHE